MAERRAKLAGDAPDSSGWVIKSNIPEDIWESFQGVIYRLE
jgi:hypothetical protein